MVEIVLLYTEIVQDESKKGVYNIIIEIDGYTMTDCDSSDLSELL